ncbi:helix-turn-helix transcriptional regulator [Streptomyces sp. cg35]|uniref:helix-turn-helix transcriptional regulator n=1 Tax=Streptomyces sp. cg35 TaxID=3421650 RepID=UPI003D171F91
MESLGTTVVGRAGEQETLSAFVTEGAGRALVLRGETGVGKSTLMDQVARLAADEAHRLIRIAGVETESELPFAGLHQLLHPLLNRTVELDEQHRALFDVVFGLSAGPPPSVMALGIAVLDLLALASARDPLTFLIDDGQWLDDSSAEVCGFVARRLSGSSVRVLVALRSDVRSRFDTAALPEVGVEPLSDEAAGQLLDLRHPQMDKESRQIVLEHAQGNPLALLELPPHVVGSGRGARMAAEFAGFGGVSLPRRLQHVYGVRIERLAPAVRTELLRGALDGVGAGNGRGRAHGAQYRMENVDEAAAAGLLEVDPVSGDFLFRHPLIRGTVAQLATPNQRRAAHAELARVHRTDLERRAGHLAAATIDPDDEVAATLEAAAGSATRRGGAAAAVSWLTRAAELSEQPADRSRRLGDAAYIAGQAALLDQARTLVHYADPGLGAAGSMASVITTAYVGFFQDGEVRPTHQQVMAAVERLRDDGPDPETDEALNRLLAVLLAICQYASDAAMWRRTESLLDSLGERVHTLTAILRDAWGDVVLHGSGLRERVEKAFTAQETLAPWDVTRLTVAAYHVDALSMHRPYMRRAVEREKDNGAVSNAMTMLHLIMLDQMASGEWAEAEETGERALELALAHGYTLLAHHSRAYLGLLAATQGRLERARELQAAVDAWARPRGVGFLTQISEATGAAAALSEGDYEAAYLYAIGITRPGSFEPYAHQASRTLLDLVEAAVHTGRGEQGRQHALAAHDVGLPHVSPRLALITLGALAMTAEDPKEAEDLYTRAEAHPAARDLPFELARIRLAHGIRLRHTSGPRTARPVLTRAAETFDRLGAAAWAERAHAELRASGLSTRTSALHLAALTWQERRIAELAAGGLTNKEIGERMRLSPRTVSSHLYRIFPKLGITSRAALRDALGRTPEGDHR